MQQLITRTEGVCSRLAWQRNHIDAYRKHFLTTNMLFEHETTLLLIRSMSLVIRSADANKAHGHRNSGENKRTPNLGGGLLCRRELPLRQHLRAHSHSDRRRLLSSGEEGRFWWNISDYLRMYVLLLIYKLVITEVIHCLILYITVLII